LNFNYYKNILKLRLAKFDRTCVAIQKDLEWSSLFWVAVQCPQKSKNLK
jgi:hypothetical protein